MDTQVALAIIGLVGTITTAVISGVIAYLMAKLNIKQAAAAVKVEEVAVKQEEATKEVKNVAKALVKTTDTTNKKLDDAAEKRDAMAVVGQATHTLVNAKMGAVLLRIVNLTESNARKSGTWEDAQIAKLARDDYEEHQKKQAEVDAAVYVLEAVKKEGA